MTDFSCHSFDALLRGGTKYTADIIGTYSVLTAIWAKKTIVCMLECAPLQRLTAALAANASKL